MLIQFSVANFRSIREKQTFSMVAAPRLGKKENTVKLKLLGEKLPPLLKVAAIYGPNASGKSNLVKALKSLVQIALNKPSTEIKVLPFSAFRFDPNLVNEPSRIEIDFVTDGLRYEFILAATEQRIHEEKLTVFPKGEPEVLYSRKFNKEIETYEIGPYLEGSKELHEVWKSLTGSQVLFISQAVANSKSDLIQLRMPFNWISTSMGVVRNEWSHFASATQELIQNNPKISKHLSEFLHELDVPITKIEVEDFSDNSTQNLLKLNDGLNVNKKSKTTLTHLTELGEAKFDFNEESEGTQNLIGFFLPWYVISPETHGDGWLRTLIVDELDSSLHPSIVACIVKKHIASKNQSQLIFTTHDTHLMDTKILRRDQFWITERDKNGATHLRSIHEFDGRESEDIEKRYYEGRYRGLPFVKRY